jgi:hypothetical protein
MSVNNIIKFRRVHPVSFYIEPKEMNTHPVSFNFKRRNIKEKVKSDPLTIVDSLKTRCSTSIDTVMGDEILYADNADKVVWCCVSFNQV